MIVVRATVDDAAEILALQRLAYRSEAAIYGDWSIPPLVQTLDELAREFEAKTFFKATENGVIVGSVRGHVREGTGFLERLVVDPAFQGRGIGSLLVEALEAAFPDARRFELFTGHKSERNLALYGRLGYTSVRREPVHSGLELVYLEKVPG